ncbi:MAG: hypothetical protein BMS9Abin08_1269 [Gammaproteobacteria bacterium]|nr:MAG: hypothetical protein BMS9Abin08_1269 [Gammaproteobacteria bacterium]
MFGLFKKTYCKTLNLGTGRLEVIWSKGVEKELIARSKPLVAEMKLEYRCMPTKVVTFLDSVPVSGMVASVTENFFVVWSTTISAHCDTSQTDNIKSDQPLPARANQKTPRQLIIDLENGKWHGEYNF